MGNASLIQMPSNLRERESAWRALTSGVSLFECLRQCVQRRASADEFAQVLAALDEWNDWQTLLSSNSDFRLPHWNHQWQSARNLTELSQRAASQPVLPASNAASSSEAQQFERICAGTTNAREWDAWCALSGRPRVALPGAQASLSVLLEQDQVGCLALLEIELVADGTGEIYPDPLSNGFLKFEKETFLAAAESSWERVKQTVALKQSERAQLDVIDVRFRLRHVPIAGYRNPQLQDISGHSAQAAFHLCLLQVASAQLGRPALIPLDQSIAVSATIQEDNQLGGVFALGSKLEAAYLAGLALVVVAEKDKQTAEEALQAARVSPSEAAQANSLVIASAGTISELITFLRERAKEKVAVRQREREACSQLNLLGRLKSIETHYQELPLLREVKRERLLHAERNGDEDKDDRFAQPRGFEIHRWEESLSREQITYEQHSLAEVFTNFQSIAKEAKSDEPRFVVLGPPGSGKSALTQYLIWDCCHPDTGTVRGLSLSVTAEQKIARVPARVSLRDWEAWATKPEAPETGLPEYLANYRYKNLSNAPTAEHWRAWLERGEVLLLLDGLDEIAGKPSFTQALTDALEFSAKCPTILTCRTVSFEQHRVISPDFPIFTLAGLTDDLRDKFISKSLPESAAQSLTAQLKRAPQMHALAANPLLLAILCYVVDEDGPYAVQLPATRSELYDKAIEKMLLTHTRGFAVNYPEGSDWPPTHKRRVLERAALTLFVSNEQDRQLTFAESNLLGALTKGAEAEGFAYPASVANALRTDLIHNSGLLRGDTERGYFFLHLTIQEYLAAGAIARLINAQGWDALIEVAAIRVTAEHLVNRKAWDPRYQEVIVFLTGQLKDPYPLLEMLADENQDDNYRHRLALACHCLPELKSTIRNTQPEIIDLITTKAFGLWWDHHGRSTLDIIQHFSLALPALVYANGHVAIRQTSLPLLDLFCTLLRDHSDVCSEAAQAVSKLGAAAAIPEILDALIDLIWRYSEEIDWHYSAAMAVGQIGTASSSDDFLAAFVSLLRSQDDEVRSAALQAAGKLGPVTPEILDALGSLLKDKDASVRRQAAHALIEMGAGAAEPEMIYSLSNLWLSGYGYGWEPLRRLEEKLVGRWRATTSACDFLDALETLLRHHDDVRRKAAPDFLDALDALLRHQDEEVRREVTRVIDEVGTPATPDFLDALVALLRHNIKDVRREAIRAVGNVGATAALPEILSLLTTLLYDSEVELQSETARAVGKLGAKAARLEILTALNTLLHDCRGDLRENAAQAVGNLGSDAAIPAILNGLSTLLRDRKETEVIVGGMRRLSGNGYPLIQYKWDHKCLRAIEAVGKLGTKAATPEILAELITLLQDTADELRTASRQTLSQLMKLGVRIFIEGRYSFEGKSITELSRLHSATDREFG